VRWLLDFPTILIDHVETDLAANIRRKVKSDPYYNLPKQINELTDKHGNFVIKKGKSCLLKLPCSTLQMHLANTPMYVMIIDSYPEIPKLLGVFPQPVLTKTAIRHLFSFCCALIPLSNFLPSPNKTYFTIQHINLAK
jgi:hypothetical protein